MSPDLFMLLSFALCLMIGMPVAYSLGIGGAVGIIFGLSPDMLATLGTNTYNSVAKYPLIAIPLFILTGIVFERVGVAASLVTFAQSIIGRRPGGLTLVVVMVCLIMAGMSGSGPADAAAVAMVMLPSMTKAGYPRAFSATMIAASSSTAILIPPSIALILYSVMLPGMDLRALFAAGLFPGILAGISILIPCYFIARIRGWEKNETDAIERPPFRQSFIKALPALFAPVIILGGLRSGLFTPTEAAAVAVAYGLFIGVVVYRQLTWRSLFDIFNEAAKLSGIILLIIALAGIFAWAGTTLGTFTKLAEAMLSISDNAWVLLILIMILVLFAGMLLDAISIYLILTPVLIPFINHFEWNPVWFGILLAMNIAIGQFTPPVAVNLLVTTKVANIRLEHTFGWAILFMLAMFSALLIVMLFPGIALWLPEYLGFATD